jgi:lipopolysaccharide export system permease protein
VKILHRYVLKEHVGPLTFALTALTSILLLQYIGKHFGELVGKGLPAVVIAEFFALSIPLTVALTLPMAVLVATLYAFSRLAAENEITALKASGVSLVSVLKPVLWAALGVTVVMIAFESQAGGSTARHRSEETDLWLARAGDQRGESRKVLPARRSHRRIIEPDARSDHLRHGRPRR